MKALRSLVNRKYFWMELGFLFFLSFAVSLISDLEYSAYEEHNISKFSNDFGYRLITESLEILVYGLYYWGFVKRYVFKRNLMGIILSAIAFVAFDHIFNKYITNWALIHSGIVSAELRKRAVEALHNPAIFFTFNYLLISAIFPLIGLAFVVRSLTQDSDIKALKEQQLISELNYLKAQLHPHFFFNTINNIYGLALKQSPDTAPMVARLGEMMRYILYEANQPVVPLSREIEFLRSYIEVEKMRRDEQVDIQFDTQDIHPGYLVEPLLLLPFVENAFKHGLEEETGKGFVHAIICQNEEELTLQVSNSKPAQVQAGKTAGIGISNVRKRLDILYADRYALEITDEPESYNVNLVIKNV
ncbi:MAG: histidine kinase [Bacteroidota bacterium]